MRVAFILDRFDAWVHGIWWHRQQTPSEALAKRGHGVKQFAIGKQFTEDQLNWPDVVVFGRTYPTDTDPVKWMREFKKRGKRILYDLDDDYWNVAKDNPSVLVSNAQKDQYETLMRECDAFITPSNHLAKKIKKHFKKPIFICPNGVDKDVYVPRPRAHGDELVIGYMGAASHWKDLQLIGKVLSKLGEKYQFLFTIYGLVGEPLESAFYGYQKVLQFNLMPEKNEYYKSALGFANQLKNIRMFHIPFMPPELHPMKLSQADFDIGLAPLEDNEFNRGKSCIKFYEYAAVGTPTIASDVTPYSDEVKYRAKNTEKDWYNKIEKLIVDKDFREKLAKEQYEWVMKNRSIDAIGLQWELACQLPGGMKVLNQS
jgi:glycosyltransferase involved in cell wall biosynthesis